MPSYLVQVAYESAAVATLVKKPQDRLAVVSKVVQKLGGTLIGGWLCFVSVLCVASSRAEDPLSSLSRKADYPTLLAPAPEGRQNLAHVARRGDPVEPRPSPGGA